MTNQNLCKFCHNDKLVKGKQFGKVIFSKTQWWDFTRKTMARKRVITSILSPENKHPKLRSTILFRYNPEAIFDFEINYCPKCGRKLGETDDAI